MAKAEAEKNIRIEQANTEKESRVAELNSDMEIKQAEAAKKAAIGRNDAQKEVALSNAELASHRQMPTSKPVKPLQIGSCRYKLPGKSPKRSGRSKSEESRIFTES